jgi:cytochrome c
LIESFLRRAFAPFSGELLSMSFIRPLRFFALSTLLATTAACASDVTKSAPAEAKGDVAAATVNAEGTVNAVPKGNAAKGQELFAANACGTCHGLKKSDTSMVGPSLFGVLGRKAGTSPSLLGASENLKKYGVIWSAETLDEFLANPDAKVPGTPMIGMLADPQQRADMIAYLSTLKE